MGNFQSYLFVGNRQDTENEVLGLAKILQIDSNSKSLDFVKIQPEGQSVTIDQIRNLKKHVFQKPLKGKFRLFWIQVAEKLTLPAQNALLKILEEPPQHAIIALCATNAQSIIQTVRSRVQESYTTPKLKKVEENTQVLNKNFKDSLYALSQVEDPTFWIDQQISSIYYIFVKNLKMGKHTQAAHYFERIKDLAQTKKMIDANVNPKFALFSLALQI